MSDSTVDELDDLFGEETNQLDYIIPELRQFAVPLDKLNVDSNNAINHPEKNITAIEKSFTRFGQRIPIVIQTQGNTIRAGNGRYEAAKRLGWTHIAALFVDESEIDAVAFALADNRTGELNEWDYEALTKQLEFLGVESIEGLNSLDIIGFDESDLRQLLDTGAIESEGYEMVNGVDDLEHESFTQHLKDKSTDFVVTLAISKKYQDVVIEYIKDNGKERIVDEIINVCGG